MEDNTNFEESNNNQSNNNSETGTENNANLNFLDSDLLLLLIILFIFFQNNSVFSEQFQMLNSQIKTVKNYLDTADATIQALDQASQIPNQMLK